MFLSHTNSPLSRSAIYLSHSHEGCCSPSLSSGHRAQFTGRTGLYKCCLGDIQPLGSDRNYGMSCMAIVGEREWRSFFVIKRFTSGLCIVTLFWGLQSFSGIWVSGTFVMLHEAIEPSPPYTKLYRAVKIITVKIGFDKVLVITLKDFTICRLAVWVLCCLARSGATVKGTWAPPCCDYLLCWRPQAKGNGSVWLYTAQTCLTCHCSLRVSVQNCQQLCIWWLRACTIACIGLHVCDRAKVSD